ncbi:MAG: putative DNA binding domain-containing protein [Euryarchaeota archaeon]|nr:putative DNA binding domain-containing protein [Euryarchaeota archaeon]
MKEEEMQLALKEGEGYKIEFKETLSNIDKEIVAFSNSSGGRIFLEVGDDNKVKGISNTFATQFVSITRLLAFRTLTHTLYVADVLVVSTPKRRVRGVRASIYLNLVL